MDLDVLPQEQDEALDAGDEGACVPGGALQAGQLAVEALNEGVPGEVVRERVPPKTLQRRSLAVVERIERYTRRSGG